MSRDTQVAALAPAGSTAETYKENQAKLESLLRRRFFIAPSFEIYGSAAGLFDFGPPGCAVKHEIEAYWRRHFVLEEDLLEISGPNLTPHCVLEASGHVDRFLDWMVEDVVTKECYRCDKLIGEFFDHMLAKSQDTVESEKIRHTQTILESLSASDMQALIEEYDIRSPASNKLTKPYPFQLMFQTRIGPKQASDKSGTAYLRPETAQGIFVNFRRLLDQNAGKMPFGAACLGVSFRNEIAPRNGLLRVREFPMAEIEYFCDPTMKSPFPKFETVKDLVVPLFSREQQLQNRQPLMMKLADAIMDKTIDNETLAYFIGRTFLFLKNIGINLQSLRFRQHLATEMAHYASDCWDAEILTSYKWIECVGIADRSAYDLSQHSKVTHVDLQASRHLREPRLVESLVAVANRKLLGPRVKRDLQDVLNTLDTLSEEDMKSCAQQLTVHGTCSVVSGTSHKTYTLDSDVIKFELEQNKVVDEAYIPNVIEPSFGIGRIMYALFEHAFRSRGLEGQEDRNYLAFCPSIAPIKCSILPISSQVQFAPFLHQIRADMLRLDMSCKIDCSNASIGKRYARTDEIGIPFGVTVDFQTLEDHTITVRERNSMEQIRLPAKDVAALVKSLVRLEQSWKDVQTMYPTFEQQTPAE